MKKNFAVALAATTFIAIAPLTHAQIAPRQTTVSPDKADAPSAKTETSDATAPTTGAPTESQKALDDVDGEGRSALMRATEDHNTDEMARLVKAGASVDIADTKYGGTALFTATWASQLDSMKLLIDAGADVNHLNTQGETALEAYAATSKLDAMRMLIEAGIDRKFVPNAIAKAKANNRPEIVDYLSNLPAAVPGARKPRAARIPATPKTAPIAAQDKALYDAVKIVDDNRADATEDNWETIKKLLDEGATAHYADNTGMTTLMMMTRCDQHGRLTDAQSKTLVTRSELNAADSDGNTALHYAATYGNRRLVEMLVAAGADSSLLNRNGSTPANMTTSGEIKNYLNGAKNQVATQTPEQNAATAPAATAPAPNAAQTAENYASATAEIFMVLQRPTFDAATVEKLLRDGADIQTANSQGSTALMFASAVGTVETARWILSKNVPIDAANQIGMTALMYAAERTGDEISLSIVTELLKNHANARLKNKDGKTALDLARAKGNSNAASTLEKAMAAK